MIQTQILKLTNLGGGANEKVAAHLIADNQSAPPDENTLPLKNCHTNKSGKIVKRNGYTVYTGPITVDASPDISVDDIRGIFEFNKFGGNKFDIAFSEASGVPVIVDFSTPASPVDLTGSCTWTVGTHFDFAVVADKVIVTTEDRDEPLIWDGLDASFAEIKRTISGSPDVEIVPPKGKFCEEFFNYGFIANTNDNPERVYWSGLFDPLSWTAVDFKRLSDGVTGLIRRGDHLFLFTKSSITLCQYTGDSVTPFQFDDLDTNVGCISNRTLKNIEGVLFWLGGDGYIYRMAGFKPERITEAIPVTTDNLNVGGFDIACAEDHRELRQYWCAVTKDSSTICDFVIAYDYLNNEIFFYDGMSINCLANMKDSNGSIKTYFGDNTGRIYLTNNGGSDYPANVQTAINFWKYTKQFDLGRPGSTKRIRRIKITANNAGNYTSLCTILGDFGATGGTATTVNHNGGGDLLGITWELGTSRLGRISNIQSRSDLAFNSKYVQLKFSNNAFEQPVEISDVELMFQEYDQDKF
jgi:hypothetical protein